MVNGTGETERIDVPPDHVLDPRRHWHPLLPTSQGDGFGNGATGDWQRYRYVSFLAAM
jgi:hypothetical protein